MHKEFHVDFIAHSPSKDEWKMVLVEEGPWPDSAEIQLRRIQGRLYDCIDAALDGQLAEKFPESIGKKILIQLDCYNLPRTELVSFFEEFSDGVFSVPDYKKALRENAYVKDISFEINFDKIH